MRVAGFGSFFAMLFGAIWALTGGIVTTVFILVGGAPWGERVSLFGPWLVLPGIMALAGAVLLVAGLLGWRRRRAIYVDGDAREAEVTAVERTAMRQNRQTVYRVRYRLRDGTAGSWTTLQPPPPGARVWALVDPMDPTRSVLA